MKSYYQEPNITLYQGHTLDVLKEMPSESVDCVMTSPPYWGLRTYKTEPIIWDNHNDCVHEWESIVRNGISGGLNSKKHQARHGVVNFQILPNTKQDFCSKCHAWKGELGLEPTIGLYVSHLMQVFTEVKRVLKKTGTCWVNIADSYYGGNKGYGDTCEPGTCLSNIHGDIFGEPTWLRARKAGIKNDILPKSLCAIPERFMLAMISQGWICRNDIIWYKANPMPESVKDRFTGTYEHLYFFVKSKKYWFEQQFDKAEYAYEGKWSQTDNKEYQNNTDMAARKLHEFINNGTRNKRDVWEINTEPYPEAHFATFPEKLCETPVLSGCPNNGTVLDPFCGSGTTLAVAKRYNRKGIGVELNPDYCKLAQKRIQKISLPMCIA